MARINQSPREYRLQVDKFRGVDFANSEITVKEGRSVNSINMIADLSGRIVKRTGYETLLTLDGRINGIHRTKTQEYDHLLIHAGTKLYRWTDSAELLLDGLNDARSTSYQHNGKLAILDGKELLCYEDGTVDKATNKAYIPTVLIACKANAKEVSGGSYEEVNLLTPKRYINYMLTSSDTGSLKFYVPEGKLEQGWVVLQKKDADGEWVDVDCTPNYAEGYVTASITGIEYNIDNVRLGYMVTPKENGADKINKCTVGLMYGVNGNSDRLFISGNEDEPNIVRWSDLDDIMYYPDRNYITLGADSSSVMGFARINDYLGVFKDDNGQDSTIYLISGTLDSENTAVFRAKAGVNGAGAVSRYAFDQFAAEPVFLTKNGLYAVTTQEITFEQYAQERSFYVNPKLVNENLADAVGISYNNYYYLSVGGKCYVADGRQKVYENNAPMSSYQYEWYYWENVPARVWFAYDDHLYFGTEDGKIKRFYKSNEQSATNNVYNDDGIAVYALWDTPYYYLNSMTQYKHLKRFVVMLAPYSRSGVKVYYRAKGERRMAKEANVDIFDFDSIDFTRFTFNTDDSPALIATNQWLKKFMMIQFRFENDRAEPFSLYGFEGIYTINSKYKG